MNQSSETAILGLGNFWEPEYEFSKLHGVLHTEVGYTGGTSSSPTYHNMGDHTEAVQITFDPHVISFEQLLEKFWELHDPTAEYEKQYRSMIFYVDEAQRQIALASKEAQQHNYDNPLMTEIVPAARFYTAETYNQHYIAKLRSEI